MPTSFILTNRPLKDVQVLLDQLGMDADDALVFAEGLAKAGLSTGNELHCELIRDFRELLVNKVADMHMPKAPKS